jgi:chromosome segregation ATPase
VSIIALHLYEQLTEAPDDRTRAKLIAEAFGQLEEHYPRLQELATAGHVRESELRLQKEIEGVRLEIKEVEGKLQKEIREVEGTLQKEIEGVRLEIREVEGKLQKEIEGVRLEIKEVELRLQREIRTVEVKIAETRADLIRWVVAVGLLQTTVLTAVLLKIAHLL